MSVSYDIYFDIILRKLFFTPNIVNTMEIFFNVTES